MSDGRDYDGTIHIQGVSEMSVPQEGLKCDLVRRPDQKISRRDFLGFSALWACVTAWVLTTVGLLKFPKPALLPDVSRVFKIGRLEDFPVGTTRIIEEKKVLVRRDEKGISAISLVCTHLGCIVAQTEKGFSCPCHGSKFNDAGDVVGGPAPKSLNWLEVSQLPNGKLVVNAGKQVSVGTKFVV